MYQTLQWSHRRIKVSPITAQQLVQIHYNENINALHHLPFAKWIHWWPKDSPHKGTVMWRVIPCYDIMMTSTWAQLNGRKHSSKTNQGNGGKLWQKWDICSAFISASIYGWCGAKFIQPSVVITSPVFSEYSQRTLDVKAWKRFSDYRPFVREIHWVIPSQMVIDANILCFFFVSLNRQSSYWWFWTPCCSFDITVMIYGRYDIFSEI